jgi:hypothetical protein
MVASFDLNGKAGDEAGPVVRKLRRDAEWVDTLLLVFLRRP